MRKRLITLLLAICLVTTLLPMSALAANGPNVAGSDQNAFAYINIGSIDNTDTSRGVYIYSASAHITPGTVTGASYNSATNTLTLTNFSGADQYIETNMMGDDFTIELSGSNYVGQIVIWGWGYGGNLRLTGSGSLAVNQTSTTRNGGIRLYAEDSYSALTFTGTGTVTVNGTGSAAVMVMETTAASNGIACGTLPTGAQVESIQNPQKVTATLGDSPFPDSFPLYTKSEAPGQSFSVKWVSHTNMNTNVTVEGYVVYSITGDPSSGYTATVLDETDTTPLTEFPAGYIAVPGRTYNWHIGDASGDPLTSVIFGSGGAPLTTPPTITTASLSGGIVGTAYTANLAATPNVTGKTITWDVTSGSLPNGLTLSENGAISGTPTAAGSFDFVAKATEADGGTASRGYTITIAAKVEAGDIAYTPGVYYPGDKLAVTVPMGVTLGETDVMSLQINDARTPYSMTRGENYFYAYIAIPSETNSVTKLTASGMVKGQSVTKAEDISDITFGGTLKFTLIGANSTADLTLKQGNAVYASYPDYASETVLKLPAGDYTASFSGYAEGYGEIELCEDKTVTVVANVETPETVALAGTATTMVQPIIKLGASVVYNYGYRLNWYRVNGEDKTLISTAEFLWLLDSETDLYFQAVPEYGLSALYDPSALRPAVNGAELVMAKKDVITVTGSLTATDPNDPSKTVPAYGAVTVTRPGLGGYSDGETVWPVYNSADKEYSYSVSDVTAGSVITFSPENYYGCDPVSYTVTGEEELTSGTLIKDLTAPLSKGTISFADMIYETEYNQRSFNLYSMNTISVTKSDGTELPFTLVRGNALAITDTSGLLDNDAVTIHMEMGWDTQLPDAVIESTVTLSSERLLGSVPELTMCRRGSATISGSNTRRVTAAALLYDADAKLLTMERDASSAWNDRFTWDTPCLPAGTYSAYLVQQDYLDTLTPESYAANPAFESGAFVKTDFAVEDKTTTRVTAALPTGGAAYSAVNFSASSLSMSPSYSGAATIDLSVVLKNDADIDRTKDVVLTVLTNQTDKTWQSGAVNTYALTINGKAVTVSRFDADGRMEGDGKLKLTLTGEELAGFGGFPLNVSAVIKRSAYDSLSAEAYISYFNKDGRPRYSYVGSFAQNTPGITLEAPAMTSTGSFTVYGNATAYADVTIYLDGMQLAKVKTDRRGYYTAVITLNHPAEYDGFTLTAASGAALSPAREVMYSAQAASIEKVTIFWKSHSYDSNYQSMPVWENGAASSMYKYYYRGATNVDSDEKIYWEIEVKNPDKMDTVTVHVPRSGETVELEATRVGYTDVFATEPYFFYGTAPSGMYVTWTGDMPAVMSKKTAVDSEDFAKGVEMLNESGVISDMTGDSSNLSFNLNNGNGSTILVTMTYDSSTGIDQAEQTELESFVPDEGRPSHILYYGEGYLANAGGYWGTERLCKYTVGADTIYQREIYTLSQRIITTWDVNANTKSTSTLTIGQGGNQVDEFTGDSLKEYRRTDQVHKVWLAFYSRLGEAVLQAAPPTPSFRLMGLVGEVADKAVGAAEDSFTWAEGTEINIDEIRQIKDFLDANPCLTDAFGKLQGVKDNPYRVVGEINATFSELCLNWLQALVSVSTTAGTGTSKEVAEIIYEGAQEASVNYAKSNLFGRQAENLASELFDAALKAQNTKGDCPEGIKWDKFPNDLYDISIFGWRTLRAPGYPQGRYDPSGYIYEAVPSNRVTGATVQLYTYDGGAVFADSTDMGIEPNPQTTAVDGRYQWFVPEGYWQVRVSKAGYTSVSTGESASYGLNAENKGTEAVPDYWMPVLPVQLDVNIGLVSYAPPAVQTVLASPDGVYVTFSKYMKSDLAETLFLIDGNTPEAIAPLNAEASSDADGAAKYASVFRLTYPAGVTPDADDEVNVFVNKSVQSYAGVGMSENYADSVTVAALAQVEPLTASVPAGEVPVNTVVTLTSSVSGASIYYSSDGTAPTVPYTGGIVIDAGTTVKAIARKPGMADSELFTVSYTVPALPAPTTPPSVPYSPEISKIIGPGAGTAKAPSVTVIGNGKVSIAADCVKLTFIPNEGNYLSKLVVNGDEVKPNADGTYTLPYPCPCHTVDVTFKQGEAPAVRVNPFTDVKEDAWYYDAVLWAAEEKITEGTGTATFSPNDVCTRAQMATFLWRAAGSPEPTIAVNPFTDVSADAYYYKAVLWAAEKGITQGTDATTFSPNDTCTRGQMATFLYRYAGSPVVTGSNPFTDVAADAYYYNAVVWAAAEGVTKGTSDTTFSPNENCTRGQIMTFLYRYLVK